MSVCIGGYLGLPTRYKGPATSCQPVLLSVCYCCRASKARLGVPYRLRVAMGKEPDIAE